MFSYYGGKSKIIKKYPAPIYDTIIEPFAGAAYYSVTFAENRNVWLNDKYEVIYKIWKYLAATSRERIEALPNLKKGDTLKDFDLTEAERYLMGFAVGAGRAEPGYQVTAFGDKTSYPKDDYRWRPNSIWTLTKNRILENLDKVKNWNVTNLDYRELPDIEATWYIDPPYFAGGDLYVHNEINYEELAEWCKSRRGQVIVCENSKANWLPFRFLTELKGQKHWTNEVIWTNT